MFGSVLVSALAACSDHAPTAPDLGYGIVRIAPVLASYGAGSYARLELENVGPSALFAGACPDALEQETATGWQPVSADPVCDAALVMIQPGTIGPGSLLLGESLKTGLYRVRYDSIAAVEGTASKMIGTRYSETFSVTAAPAR